MLELDSGLENEASLQHDELTCPYQQWLHFLFLFPEDMPGHWEARLIVLY